MLQAYQDHVESMRAHFRAGDCERFCDDCLLNRSVLRDIALLASEKMHLTLTDRRGHSASWSGTDVAWRGHKILFFVETIPANMGGAASWYSDEYGGYVQFITKLFNNTSMHFGCIACVHCIFGINFAAVGIFPLSASHASIVPSVFPRPCISATERAEYGID
jgi:hypothetical protein